MDRCTTLLLHGLVWTSVVGRPPSKVLSTTLCRAFLAMMQKLPCTKHLILVNHIFLTARMRCLKLETVPWLDVVTQQDWGSLGSWW